MGTAKINFGEDAASDAAGNASQAPTIINNEVTFDPGNLTVDLNCSAPDSTNTAYQITITFNRAINPDTFATSDFDFTAGDGYIDDLTTSDNIVWTATVTPTSQGTNTVTLPAGVVTDTYGVPNQAAPAGVTRTWDTVAPQLLPDVSAASKIIVLNTTSLTTSSIYTPESNITASYVGSTSPYTVTLSDQAGNETVLNNIYVGGASIITAFNDSTLAGLVYIAQEGEYTIGGGGSKIVWISLNTVTLKGISTGVIIRSTSNQDNLSVFEIQSSSTLYLENLAFKQSQTVTGMNYIGSTTGLSFNLYLKNIRKDTTASSSTDLVDIQTTGSVYVWSSGQYIQITTSGDGWTVATPSYRFPGVQGVTYWSN